VRRTLRPLVVRPPQAVILGCTHYPLLRSSIRAALPGVRLVDSRAVAQEVRAALAADARLAAACNGRGRALEVVVTDRTPHFERFAERIMGTRLECRVVPHEALELRPRVTRAGRRS
jgi:glutamate racemase